MSSSFCSFYGFKGERIGEEPSHPRALGGVTKDDRNPRLASLYVFCRPESTLHALDFLPVPLAAASAAAAAAWSFSLPAETPQRAVSYCSFRQIRDSAINASSVSHRLMTACLAGL